MISLRKNRENEWMEHLEALEFVIMIFFINDVDLGDKAWRITKI